MSVREKGGNKSRSRRGMVEKGEIEQMRRIENGRMKWKNGIEMWKRKKTERKFEWWSGKDRNG